MEDLFPRSEAIPGSGPAETAAGASVRLAMNANLWRTFDYLWPADWPAPKLGQRVRAPFGKGNRSTLAFVAGVDQVPGRGDSTVVAAEAAANHGTQTANHGTQAAIPGTQTATGGMPVVPAAAPRKLKAVG